MPGRPYLLDTSTLSDLIRRPQGRVADKLAEVDEERVVTSIVVACELRYGAAKRGSKRLTRQVEAVLGAIAVLPFETGVDGRPGSTPDGSSVTAFSIVECPHGDRSAASRSRLSRHGGSVASPPGFAPPPTATWEYEPTRASASAQACWALVSPDVSRATWAFG